MTNLLFRELKKNFKAFLIWLILLILVNAFLLSAFESVAETATQPLTQYPPVFVKAMLLDQFDMTDILHYYASRSYILVTLFGSIYAVMLAGNILSKEESDQTIEFLLSKPISRSEIITAKLLCILLYLTLFDSLFAGSNFLLMDWFKLKPFDFSAFLLVSIGGFLTHLIFATISYLLSVFVTRTKTILSLSLGLVFITYFLNLLASIEEKIHFVKYLSPFSYYSAEDLVIQITLNSHYFVISLLVIYLSIGLTYFSYLKKDIAG